MVGTLEKIVDKTEIAHRDLIMESVHTVVASGNNRVNEIKNILGWKVDTNLAVVDVTADMATELLKFNDKNRKVIKSAVAKYSKSLINGDFTLSNDMITFDSQGVLTNGQHRLLAIKETGIALSTVVMIGVEQSSEMDRGAKRNIVDNLILTGNIPAHLSNSNIIKVCKALLDYFESNQKYTCARLEEFINDNEHAIYTAYSSNLLVLQGNGKKIFNVQIAAAFLAAVMYYEKKFGQDSEKFSDMLDKLIHIREVLTAGIVREDRDIIIIKLRDKIKDTKSSKNNLTKNALFKSTQYTIYHYCNGIDRKTIKCDKHFFI